MFHICTYTHVGGLQLRNLIVLTSNIKGNWYNLGIDLKIPITKMENLYGKYYANPMKALNRVYCYWLSDKNGLSPTWEKLCSSLRKIKEFTIAADVEKFLQVSLNTNIIAISLKILLSITYKTHHIHYDVSH